MEHSLALISPFGGLLSSFGGWYHALGASIATHVGFYGTRVIFLEL